MASLLDIVPETKTVTVQGKDIEVFGVSTRGIAHLIGTFPELKKALAGKKQDFTPERLMKLLPDCVASIIAAGCGMPGDKEAEKLADKLSASDQLDLLEAIIKLTMPDGVGPFVERLNALGLLGRPAATASATQSPPASNS